MKLSDAKQSVTHTVCVFGPPKCGKTKVVGKLAEHFKLIWIDLENGWSTLTKLPPAWQDNITLITIPDTRQFPMGIETCMKIFTGSLKKICEEHGKVDCALCTRDKKPFVEVDFNNLGPDTIVVLDSGTQLTNSAISNITKGQDVTYKMQTDDWGSLGKYLDMVLSYVQQATYNCVVITHEAEVEMEDGKVKLVPSFGTRNFARNSAKYFGHVVHAEVKNKKHMAASSTTYATNLLTGSRTDVVLEKDSTMSLLRIFKPELFPNEPILEDANKATPGATANNKLAELRAKMAGGAK
jgi:hypothetical protein